MLLSSPMRDLLHLRLDIDFYEIITTQLLLTRILSLTRDDEVKDQPRPRQKVTTIAGLEVT
ncbi:hypothetical protein BM1_05163 [Bipolaris maydis]|nr:hypothetical protein BM1_05163 [Bipolaris maydis]